jgi:hypothetical protein
MGTEGFVDSRSLIPSGRGGRAFKPCQTMGLRMKWNITGNG